MASASLAPSFLQVWRVLGLPLLRPWHLKQTRAASGSQCLQVRAPWPRSNNFSQARRRQRKSCPGGDSLCKGAGGRLSARLGAGSGGSQRFLQETQASFCWVGAQEARRRETRGSLDVLSTSALSCHLSISPSLPAYILP